MIWRALSEICAVDSSMRNSLANSCTRPSTRTRPPLPGPLRAGDGVQLTAGIVDQRFDGGQPADLPAGTAVPGAAFGKLDCGSFHRFWWKR